MKRMIDGIINYSVTTGALTLDSDTTISIIFDFPLGYWPISLDSKPFSILPGRIMFGDDTTDISGYCFDADGSKLFSTVKFSSGSINVPDSNNNALCFQLSFGGKANRDEFVESLFGKGATDESTEFTTPVSMLLVAFSGVADY